MSCDENSVDIDYSLTNLSDFITTKTTVWRVLKIGFETNKRSVLLWIKAPAE